VGERDVVLVSPESGDRARHVELREASVEVRGKS